MVADEVREMMGGSAVRLGKSCDEMMPPVAQGPGMSGAKPGPPTHCLLSSLPHGVESLTMPICRMRKLRPTEVL